MFPIVMLVGQAGAGKDAVADVLVKHRNATKISLAAPLKEFGKLVFQFSDDQLYGPSEMRNRVDPRWEDKSFRNKTADRFITHYDKWSRRYASSADVALSNWFWKLPSTGLTPRHVLQTLGTDWGRVHYRNIWITAAIDSAKDAIEKGTDMVVIPDGRFRNEALEVMKAGGKLIRIANPAGPTIATTHVSETESATIPDFWFDVVYQNDKNNGLAVMRKDVLKWFP